MLAPPHSQPQPGPLPQAPQRALQVGSMALTAAFAMVLCTATTRWHPGRAYGKDAGCWSICLTMQCAVCGVLVGVGSAPSSSILLGHQALGRGSAVGGPVQTAGGGPASAGTLLGAAIAELGTALLGWQDE